MLISHDPHDARMKSAHLPLPPLHLNGRAIAVLPCMVTLMRHEALKSIGHAQVGWRQG